MIWLLLLIVLAGSVLYQRGAGWSADLFPFEPSVALGLLGLLTVWAYRSVWTAGYVYEDTGWLPFWTAPPLAGAASVAYLPWTVATWLSGGLPAAYHLMALSVHLMNGLLLYRLVARFGPIAACVAVGLFWLAPVNSEAVAYLSGSREAYVAFWTLLGISCAQGKDWQALRVAVMVGCAAVALASKSSGIVALALIPYGAYLVNPRLFRRFALPCLLVAGVLGLPAVLYVLRLQHTEGVVRVSWDHAFPFAALTAAAVVRYLAEVVPYGLTIDHDWMAVSSIWPTLSLLALALVTYLVLFVLRDVPMVAAGWIWLLVALAPRFVVQQSDILDEHQIYLAFLPVWVGLGLALERVNFYMREYAYAW